MLRHQWHYPGSRWWKFDFHTHTPASQDTPWYAGNELTPQDWLLKYMVAEIDCVAITDHNSGAWIDKLKDAYQTMQNSNLAGFRELTLFPGVELSVQGGVHVLAIFSPDATSSDIDSLLGRVEYHGTKGDSNAETSQSLEKVIQAILSLGAIPIPAHVDGDKGLLQVNSGTQVTQLSATMVKQALAVENLLALEWCNLNNPWPQVVLNQSSRFARVLGSDCHNFRASNAPGSAYTWVKMAEPTLEGLRLALLDGNGVSIIRSDEAISFNAFRVPTHMITALEIEKARCIGNGRVARIECSPYFNAIVGGRGTGKSTLVHALRLALQREQEISSLSADSEPRVQFEAFRKPANGRDGKGALRSETVIRLEWQYEQSLMRLVWSANNAVLVEEKQHGVWQKAASQSVNAARFPVRIFSQGQIAALAGSGRKTLLAIVDEAAGIDAHKQIFEANKRTFFTQRARLRELDGKLADQPEVERKLQETSNKLNVLSQTDHASVLKAYALAQHQNREVNALLEQLRTMSAQIAALPEQLVLDDWSSQHFGEQDSDVLAWRGEIEGNLAGLRQQLLEKAQQLNDSITLWQTDARLTAWKTRTENARHEHGLLQQQLAQQGVTDPQAFARLTQERQQLELQHKALLQMRSDRESLLQQIKDQFELLQKSRQDITQARQSFIEQTLANNTYVRMNVVSCGFDAVQIERELRELIDVTDERLTYKRFVDDILQMEDGEASSGMAFDLAQAGDEQKQAVLKQIKQQLLLKADVGGHLSNYLQKQLAKPEFADHVETWFPEDDLQIEYQRDDRWYPMSQGSQGQRSAALLAFLLAFGNEPMVLDQPEDDLDNHLIYDLIVQQIRENKLRRQLIIVTHNPNVVVNGDADLVHVMEFGRGQCFVQKSGSLQENVVRKEVCRVMEGGHEAFTRRWMRLGREV